MSGTRPLGAMSDTDAAAVPLVRGTKGRILRLLRAGERTADELAAALEVTPNGARFHLIELERDGLVEQRPVRRGARKPSYGYSLTEQGEALFPRRYDSLLNAVLDDVRRGRGPQDLKAMFRRLGKATAARQAHRFAGRPAEARIAEALRFLGELGGAAELVADPAQPGAAAVVGQSCPFKAVVLEHPEVCSLLEAFLAEVLPDAAVGERCQKEGTPQCRFEVRSGPAVRADEAGRHADEARQQEAGTHR